MKDMKDAKDYFAYRVWFELFPFGLKGPGIILLSNNIFQLGFAISLDSLNLVIMLGVFHMQLGWLRQLP